jgi:hypothetical protein
MFALFHAGEMPLLEFGDVQVSRIAGDTWRVTAEMENLKAIPSRIEAAELYNSGWPDRFTLTGATVQAGGRTTGPQGETFTPQERDPGTIELASGIPGRNRVSVTWIVTGTGTVTLRYESLKGGVHTRTVELR